MKSFKKSIVLSLSFLMIGTVSPAFAEAKYAYGDKPACRALPSTDWSREYIEGFLTKSVWRWESPNWKRENHKGFTRWYPPTKGKNGGLFTKVAKDEFRLINGDGSVIVYSLIEKGGKYYQYEHPERLRAYLKVLQSYTGVKLKLGEDHNDAYLAEEEKYQYYPNMILMYLEDYYSMAQASHTQDMFKTLSFAEHYDKYIKGKKKVPHTRRGLKRSDKTDGHTVASIGTYDMNDFDGNYDYAFAQSIYMELLGKVHRETYRYPTVQRKYNKPLKNPYALTTLDKYLLCGMYSKNVIIGTDILVKNVFRNITNEIMYLQKLNKNNK